MEITKDHQEVMDDFIFILTKSIGSLKLTETPIKTLEPILQSFDSILHGFLLAQKL